MLIWNDFSGVLGHIFDEYGVLLSDKMVQTIKDLPIPTSVPAVRSFVGIVNYFRDFIPSLSSYLLPLTELTKKLNFGENGFEMREEALRAFWRVKDQIMAHTTRVLMNDYSNLIYGCFYKSRRGCFDASSG